LNPQRLVAYKYTIPGLWRFGSRRAVFPLLIYLTILIMSCPLFHLNQMTPTGAPTCLLFLALPLHCLFGTSNGFSFLEVGGGGLIHCGNYG
jgi:hypothetical protein